MNRVQVCPFGLILCQDGAMVSRNPLECLLPSKTAKKHQKMRKMPWGGPGGPQFALIGPYWPLSRTAEASIEWCVTLLETGPMDLGPGPMSQSIDQCI